ncbi:CaiB/BaiF CoA transferase family protein [Tomitella fengzijianii]|uniref:CaiB/BaiF CoA transferase family protein n=1 Tax=Tomitella fengzijianii TaxID=2597660 RepID=UPI001E42E69F|nr:CaiB/BaiF CoA-transferase family protein [Tomitella fengzijianii]
MGTNEAGERGTLPLDGVTVVAVEQAVAAPLATRHLADLGARVIKIERPGTGDFARHYDTAVNGLAAHFVWLNRGKESVAVDLKDPDGLDLVRRLIAGADVFVQNLAPGAAGRLGLGADTLRGDQLRAGRPGLVTVDMSGYGDEGPYRDRKAYDMLVQSEAGLVAITGTPDSPAKTGIPSADIAAGMYAFSGVLGALLRRERTGEGAEVSVSMLDSLVEWMGYPMYTAMYSGTPVERTGIAHPSIAPYDGYPTADGEVLIGVQNDDGWRALATTVLGRPELADDERYATNVERVRRRAEVDAAVAAGTRTFTSAVLLDLLAEAGIAAARLRDVPGMVAHPQISARGRWRSVGTPAGPVDAVLPPIGISGAEPAMGDVPALGQQTDAVLAGIGVGGGRIADLRERGVVQ